MLIKKINIKRILDERGSLSFIQESNLPFHIKRIYWMKDIPPNQIRGNHAHYKNRQVIIIVEGSCKICIDDTEKKKELSLNKDKFGVIIEPNYWHSIYEFSKDCIILVLASEEYEESDYIRDYNKFKEIYK